MIETVFKCSICGRTESDVKNFPKECLNGDVEKIILCGGTTINYNPHKFKEFDGGYIAKVEIRGHEVWCCLDWGDYAGYSWFRQSDILKALKNI